MDRMKTWLVTGSVLAALAVGAAVPAFAQDAEDPSTGAPTTEDQTSDDPSTDDAPPRS